MREFIIVMLISCLMGMGVGGESASLTEGGGTTSPSAEDR